MSLLQTIESDYKTAFKEGKKEVVEILRVLRTALTNEEIAKRGKTGEREAKLTEEETLAVVKRQVKQLDEAREMFAQGERADLVAQNEAELKVLAKYLPAAASEDEVRAAVKKVIEGMGKVAPADFGRVMGAAMKDLQGGADGAAVSRVVKEMLNN